jgi:REP element-mobilizing transposase RayT
MARKLRVEYPHAIYHVLNRGDRREAIFCGDRDRELFLEMLGEACRKTGWEVQAWCLMSNHFHLVVETPQANLVAGMKWFMGTYTSRFNRRHKLFGHLFSGRYKALIVDGSGDGYLRTVCDYVHLNPVRAKMLGLDQPLREYRWSSYGEYLKSLRKRAGWLKVERLFGEMGIPQDSTAGRRQFERMMEQRRGFEDPQGLKAVRRGWFLGDEPFRQELLEQMARKMGRNHGGGERQETAEAQAERIVAEELRRRKWGPSELERRRKGDQEKVRIARRLRMETTMTLNWIAQRLKMGADGHVANCLRNKE